MLVYSKCTFFFSVFTSDFQLVLIDTESINKDSQQFQHVSDRIGPFASQKSGFSNSQKLI